MIEAIGYLRLPITRRSSLCKIDKKQPAHLKFSKIEMNNSRGKVQLGDTLK